MKSIVRVLLITYSFPPIGEPRSFRWLNLTRQLSNEQYSFDVLTIQASVFQENYDSTLNHLVRTGGDVIRTYPGPIYTRRNRKPLDGTSSITESNIILKNMMRFLLIPDKSIEWLPWGYLKGRDLINMNNYDLIISSGYPFTGHILAYLLRRKKPSMGWVADYGDPWSFNPDPKVIPVGRKRIDRAIEQHILKQCDKVIVTTSETKTGFMENFCFLEENNIEVLTQGYDPAEFQEAKPERGEKFRIVYAGTFYDNIREPFEFYRALDELSDLDIEVVIAGNVNGKFKSESEKIRYIGHQSHTRVLSLQKGADILIFFGNASTYQLPGKIFEYFAAQRPILCLKYVEPDISANLIQKHKRGLSVINKSDQITNTIKNLYYRWQEKQMDDIFDLEPIEDYSWKNLSIRLGDIISKVIDR